MVKNKVLTPVLAGVLGLSIVGSGLGYYFVNKDSNDGKTEGGKAKITQVADNINNTLGTAEKAIKGELDFAYNATATVSFGEGFTEKAGVSLQPISVTTVLLLRFLSQSDRFLLFRLVRTGKVFRFYYPQ